MSEHQRKALIVKLLEQILEEGEELLAAVEASSLFLVEGRVAEFAEGLCQKLADAVGKENPDV